MVVFKYFQTISTDDIIQAYREGVKYEELHVAYPPDGALFPPEIVPPKFRWKDTGSQSDTWLINIRFRDGDSLNFISKQQEWKPTAEQWRQIKSRTVEEPARVLLLGVNRGKPGNILSAASIFIIISKDEVGAPIFYREVNLPFIDAVKDPSRIRWRFGSISSKARPKVVLENMPVCGNCHSFSSDGRVVGMDVDYANDKGSYAILSVEKDMVIDNDNIITWSDYRRDDGKFTFGLLSRVSPDGRYVISTAKDRSVFVPRDELAYSQLFFPVKGILVYYDREDGSFNALKGGDEKGYVQSNPAWSPDSRYVVFTKSKEYSLRTTSNRVLLTQEECSEFIERKKLFKYDLYRVEFNDGDGGKAEPLEGASGNGKSNYFAKYSPDGKWIVYCRAESFSLLQPDSELYIIPAGGGKARRMRCNTSNMNSWHSWSPNGRWLVFSSKANGAYTQLFLTHVDEEGNDTPAVLLENFTSPDRAANIPEFVNAGPDAIGMIRENFLNDKSFLRAGHEHSKVKDYDNAEKAYRKALEINPESAEAHYKLGETLEGQENQEEAIVQYKKALELDGDYSEVHNAMGNISASQGRLEEASGHYNKVIRLEPENSEAAHCNLAGILVMQGNPASALKHYNRALELDPLYAEAHNNIGNLFKIMGRIDKAIEHYEKALEIAPDYHEARRNMEIAEAYGKFENIIKKQDEIKATVKKYSNLLRSLKDYKIYNKDLNEIINIQNSLNNLLERYTSTVKSGKKSEVVVNNAKDIIKLQDKLMNMLKDNIKKVESDNN